VGKQPFKLCFIILCCVSKTYELSIHEVQLRGYGNPIGVLKNGKINDFLEKQQTLVFLCGFILQGEKNMNPNKEGSDYIFR
jgi:hypothetical protein